MGLDALTLAVAKKYTDEKVASGGGSGDGTGSVLPPVTAANNGNFLRVVNGVWAAASLPIAEEASF